MSSATSCFNRRRNKSGLKSEIGISGSVGFGVRRRIQKCSCGEFLVMRTALMKVTLTMVKIFGAVEIGGTELIMARQ